MHYGPMNKQWHGIKCHIHDNLCKEGFADYGLFPFQRHTEWPPQPDVVNAVKRHLGYSLVLFPNQGRSDRITVFYHYSFQSYSVNISILRKKIISVGLKIAWEKHREQKQHPLVFAACKKPLREKKRIYSFSPFLRNNKSMLGPLFWIIPFKSNSFALVPVIIITCYVHLNAF